MGDDERKLLNCFLEATCESLSHEEHIRVAWLLLRQHSLARAIEIFAERLHTLATSHGHPNLYHETITWAYMILINARFRHAPDADWETFRGENADLFASDKAVLKSIYQASTLESEFARRVFVLPDADLSR